MREMKAKCTICGFHRDIELSEPIGNGTHRVNLCLDCAAYLGEQLVRHERRSPQAVLLEVAQAHIYFREVLKNLEVINQSTTKP
jgi:hypothetical protein